MSGQLRQYWLDVIPHPKERPRSTSQGGRTWTYTPRDTQEAEREIKLLMMAQPRESFPAPAAVQVAMAFYLKRPKTVNRPWPNLSRQDADIDQLAKLVMDALTGILWDDDSQVVELRAVKRWTNEYRPTPGIVVEVAPALTPGEQVQAMAVAQGAASS